MNQGLTNRYSHGQNIHFILLLDIIILHLAEMSLYDKT